MFKAFLFWRGFYQWFYLEIQGFHMQGGFLNRIIQIHEVKTCHWPLASQSSICLKNIQLLGPQGPKSVQILYTAYICIFEGPQQTHQKIHLSQTLGMAGLWNGISLQPAELVHSVIALHPTVQP